MVTRHGKKCLIMPLTKLLHCFLVAGFGLLASCSPWARLAKNNLAGKDGLQTAHLGVLVVDADGRLQGIVHIGDLMRAKVI